MMIKLKRLYALVIIAGALVIIITCTQAPSDDEIKTAISDHLKQKVPMSWSGSLMGGKNAQIVLIEIKQVGNFNDKAKYWPIKARVKGTCQADLLFKTETKAFDRIGDFRLYQDDYGNWKASIDLIQ